MYWRNITRKGAYALVHYVSNVDNIFNHAHGSITSLLQFVYVVLVSLVYYILPGKVHVYNGVYIHFVTIVYHPVRHTPFRGMSCTLHNNTNTNRLQIILWIYLGRYKVKIPMSCYPPTQGMYINCVHTFPNNPLREVNKMTKNHIPICASTIHIVCYLGLHFFYKSSFLGVKKK